MIGSNDIWLTVNRKQRTISKENIPKFRKIVSCEITASLSQHSSKDKMKIYTPVHIKNNPILDSILEKLNGTLQEPFIIISSDHDKYKISVKQINKNTIILHQQHLHTDVYLPKGLLHHFYRYVRITFDH